MLRKRYLAALFASAYVIHCTPVQAGFLEKLATLQYSVYLGRTLGDLFIKTLVMYAGVSSSSFKKCEEYFTKNTHKQFKEWVLHIINSHESNPVTPLICIIDSTKRRSAHTISFVVSQPASESQIKSFIFFPLEYQEHLLQHLEQHHECSIECTQKIYEIIAVIDHEYAHIKHNDGRQLILLQTLIAAGYSISFALAYSFLKSAGNIKLYALSASFSTFIARLIHKKFMRAQEILADENIHDDIDTLAGGKRSFEKLKKTRKNDNLLTPLFATHPPLNQRIARLQERIDRLKNTRRTISKGAPVQEACVA